MGKLSNVWQQSRLSLATKLRVYNLLVLSVLQYGCETWIILKSDERKIEAFHMLCQRRILRIRCPSCNQCWSGQSDGAGRSHQSHS